MKKDLTPFLEKEDLYQSIFDTASDGLIVHNLGTGLIVNANPAACRMHGYARQEFIGLHVTVLIDPNSRYAFNQYLQTFRVDGIFDIRTQHIRQDGTTFYAEWRGTTFLYQGQACLMGIVRDVSRRIQAEQSLRQSVETRTHEQAMLLEISHTLASTLELQPALILDQLRGMIPCTYSCIFTFEDLTLLSLVVRGTPELEQSAPFRIPLQTPETLSILFKDHQPIRTDVWSDEPQAQFLRSLLEGRAAMLLEGIHSWMWIPLSVRGRVIGAVGLAETEKDYFTAHHADLALSVANQAAITMINAELNEQAQALAVLEERQRLARNLHDAVNQSLFSAGLIAEVLPRLWERDQDLARQSLEDLRRLTRGAQAEMRTLLAELRPSTLTDSSLGDLLQLLGNALSGRLNVPVTVTVTEDFTLPADIQITFYRICQEALYNIAKHAKASHVEMDLAQTGDTTELRIRDDGVGFDPQQTFSGHYGLSMMRERADAVGVLLVVSSEPGHGTELIVRWTKTSSKAEEAL